jgi:hypothetical protein
LVGINFLEEDSINNGGHVRSNISFDCLFADLGNDGLEQLSRNCGILPGIYGNIAMAYYIARNVLCWQLKLTKKLRHFGKIQIGNGFDQSGNWDMLQ